MKNTCGGRWAGAWRGFGHIAYRFCVWLRYFGQRKRSRFLALLGSRLYEGVLGCPWMTV